jgi:hypothetical protein
MCGWASSNPSLTITQIGDSFLCIVSIGIDFDCIHFVTRKLKASYCRHICNGSYTRVYSKVSGLSR